MNGKIKQWRYFSQTIQNSSIAFAGGYLNIICAIINAFKKTISLNTEDDTKWAAQILMLRDKQNLLQQRLEQMNHNTRKPQWKKYDARMVNFPTLTEEDVRNICFGNYYFHFICSISSYAFSKVIIKSNKHKVISSNICSLQFLMKISSNS